MKRKNNLFDDVPELCSKVVRKIAKTEQDEELIEKAVYASVGYVCSFCTFMFGLIFYTITGNWREFLILSLGILLLRKYTGGAHFNNTPYSYCLFFTNAMIGLTILFVKIGYAFDLQKIFLILSILTSVIIIYSIPKPSSSGMTRGKRKAKEFKIKYTIITILWQIINIIIYVYCDKIYTLAMSAVFFWLVFMLSDIAYIIVNKIENNYKNIFED